MLILTRRIGEKIIISDDIIIQLIGINGNQARLGIDAPKCVIVHREEIHNKIKQASKEAKNGIKS